MEWWTGQREPWRRLRECRERWHSSGLGELTPLCQVHSSGLVTICVPHSRGWTKGVLLLRPESYHTKGLSLCLTGSHRSRIMRVRWQGTMTKSRPRGVPLDWVPILPLSLPPVWLRTCFLVPKFHCSLWSGGNYSIFPMGILGDFNTTVHIKHLVPCLAKISSEW